MPRPFRFAAVVRTAPSGAAWAAKARRLEDSGFDALLISDHLVGPRLAPIAALTAAAVATTRLRVGTLVFANDYRHPALLAKEAATIDLLSDGRLDLGIGTGWMRHDYDKAGLSLDPPRVRVDRLVEALRVLKGLWADGPFSFAGEHYTITELDQQPKPVSRPHPRILLGGGGPRMLRLAAREADIINLTMRVRADGSGPDTDDGGTEAFLRKIETVREAAGERFDAIDLGTSITQVGARKDRAGWSFVERSRQDETPQILTGTVADMTAKLRHWRDTYGLSHYVLHNETDLDAFTPVVEALAGD